MSTERPQCKVLWYGKEWICRDQLQKFRFPERMTECFFSSCPGREDSCPPTVEEPKVEPKVEPKISVPQCSYHRCDKPQAPGRKYCGDTCRKRYARWAYKQRKKAERKHEATKTSL